MATTAKDRERREEAEVRRAAPQPLQAVRPSAGVHAQVRAVPSVLPQAGARRRRRRRDEEQLVGRAAQVVRALS